MTSARGSVSRTLAMITGAKTAAEATSGVTARVVRMARSSGGGASCRWPISHQAANDDGRGCSPAKTMSNGRPLT
jgi:hypothetical protein